MSNTFNWKNLPITVQLWAEGGGATSRHALFSNTRQRKLSFDQPGNMPLGFKPCASQFYTHKVQSCATSLAVQCIKLSQHRQVVECHWSKASSQSQAISSGIVQYTALGQRGELQQTNLFNLNIRNHGQTEPQLNLRSVLKINILRSLFFFCTRSQGT